MFSKLLLIMVTIGPSLLAVEVISENPEPVCEQVTLTGELPVYRDPTLFPLNYGLFDSDSFTGLRKMHEEVPLLTTFTGTIQYMNMTKPPKPFREFAALRSLYGISSDAKPRARDTSKMAPVTESHSQEDLAELIQFCGDDAYTGTFGLIFVNDLKRAQVKVIGQGDTPPSVYPNPIPVPKLSPLSSSVASSRNM